MLNQSFEFQGGKILQTFSYILVTIWAESTSGKPLARTERGNDNVSAVLKSPDESHGDDVFGRAIRAPKDLVSSQGSVGCHARELVI